MQDLKKLAENTKVAEKAVYAARKAVREAVDVAHDADIAAEWAEGKNSSDAIQKRTQSNSAQYLLSQAETALKTAEAKLHWVKTLEKAGVEANQRKEEFANLMSDYDAVVGDTSEYLAVSYDERYGRVTFNFGYEAEVLNSVDITNVEEIEKLTNALAKIIKKMS